MRECLLDPEIKCALAAGRAAIAPAPHGGAKAVLETVDIDAVGIPGQTCARLATRGI